MISVLHVDDELDFLELCRLFLERDGDFSVSLATSVDDGFAMLETTPFDIIISDYQMAGKDGIEFLVEVREKYPDIPFILFTGRGREEIAIRAFESGADFYLQKGGDPKAQFAELTQKILHAIHRKKAEGDLRERERQLNSMAGNIPGVIFRFYVRTDGSQRFSYISERSREILGIDNDPVNFLARVTACVSPDYRAAFLDSLQQAVETHREWRFEGEYLKPSGEKVWLIGSSSPVAEKNELVFDGVIFDHTERKRAEEALRLSDSCYRTLFEYTEAATVILEPDATISVANDAFATLSGYSREQIEGKKKWTEFVVAEDLERMKEYHRQRRSNHTSAPTVYEFRFRDRQENIRHILIHVGMIPGSQQSVASLLDISDRIRAQKTLKLDEQRLEALLRLNEMGAVTVEELADNILEEAVLLTNSTLGYIAFYDKDDRTLAMHTWAKPSMRQGHGATEPVRYPIDSPGLWGEAVRQRRPIITNDYAGEKLLNKGVPYGNTRITRHLNVPIFDGDRMVIVAGVANKPEHYDDADIRHLTLLMSGMWRILQRRNADVSIQQKNEDLQTSFDKVAAAKLELQRVNEQLTAQEVGLRGQIEMLAATEREVRESEAKYRSVIESVPVGMHFYQLDHDGHLVFSGANPAADTILGISHATLIGKSIEEAFPALAGTEIPEKYFTIARDGGHWQTDQVNYSDYRISGAFSVWAFQTTPNNMVAAFYDITERKRGEVAVQLANRKLNLLSNVTRHDIRNKLTIILGFLDLAISQPQNPMLPAYLRKVQESARTIESQIAFTKEYQELGVAAPQWEDINEVFMRARLQLDLRSVQINAGGNGIEIFADPLLEKVFYNLIDNALTHGGRVSTLEFSARESGEGLILSLQDNGKGVHPDDKTRIFLQGYGRQTGLGLFLVSEILSITGITIRENGTYGKGARFEMVVPRGMYRMQAKGS